MTSKELTPRQIRERAAREAEKGRITAQPRELSQPRMSTLDYLRKQAGWPPLRHK